MDNQQIKARFFGMHIGCEVMSDDLLVKSKSTLRGVSRPVGADSYNLNLTAGNGRAFMSRIDNCKLVLRPLSSITDEEAIEALTIATGLYLCDIDRNKDRIVFGGVNHCSHAVMWLNISPGPVGTFIQAWNSIAGHSQPDCHDYMAVDYLRSINICVPFMGIDPVKEGWAVLSE